MISNSKPSSLVAGIEFDPHSRVLQVTLSSGVTYAYDNVEPSDHNAFVSADSHGRHFSTVFSKKYKGRKI
jgi:hypothetical protein